MIEKTLSKIGFNEKESRIFLELMRRGKATPLALSKATGINRATVYSVAKQLLFRGVITEDRAAHATYLVALPPEELTVLIEKEEHILKKKKRLVWNAIDEMATLPRNTTYAAPKMRFVEEEGIETHLKKQLPLWNESILRVDPSKSWWGFQDHTFVEHFEEWINWYWENTPPEIELRLLSNESAIEEHMETKDFPRRHIAFWEHAHSFDATTWIKGEYITMIYTNERPFYLIELYNPVLACNMRSVFEGIWKNIHSGID